MAGDWIKVEHATLEKPEVMRTGEMLGVGPYAAIGMFARYFVWLDKNMSADCPGVVHNVSAKGLDEFMNVAGFAACLEAINWAKFDAAAWTMTVTNATRHNGNSAKTRALDAKRKAETRRNSVPEMSGLKPDKTWSREEKRREETNTTSRAGVAAAPPPRKPSAVNVSGTRLDPLWTLPIDWLEWARIERPDLSVGEVERIALVFRDHWHAKPGAGGRKADWLATWRNWVRGEKRHYTAQRGPPTLAEKRAHNMDLITGKVRNERVIEGDRVGGTVVLALPGDLRESNGDDVGRREPGGIARGVGD